MAGIRCITIPPRAHRNSRLGTSLSTSKIASRGKLNCSFRGRSLRIVRLWNMCRHTAEVTGGSSVCFVLVDAPSV